MSGLAGKSILITGGGSGLGRGAAEHFVAAGARVTICGRRRERIEAVAAELGDHCLGLAVDITIAADRETLVSAACSHGGGLDALINNAGNMYRGPVETLAEDSLLALFHSNVIAAMMLTGLCTDALAARRGAVIFLGSVHTRRAFPGVAPYAATKGAVEALSRVLAAELGPRQIRVNCILPGAVFTEINQRAGLFDDEAARERLEGIAPLHALGRIGRERDIAEAMAYLIESDWTTGATLEVDGGLGLGLTKD
ncbi:MAG: SDR family oxidoreductase [Pseudomonadota bacterium]